MQIFLLNLMSSPGSGKTTTLTRTIEALKEDMKNAAEAIEAIDKMLFAIEEFVRFKCRFVEESVNGYFRLCSFRLFR